MSDFVARRFWSRLAVHGYDALKTSESWLVALP